MKKLAKINKAGLEIKDRGVLNFWIHVDYEDGLSQGIGGYALDEFDKEKDRRVGTSYGCEVIRRLLLSLSVDDFSEMENKHIWVIGEGDGFSFKPTGVSPLYVDDKTSEPVIFKDIAEEFIDEEVPK